MIFFAWVWNIRSCLVNRAFPVCFCNKIYHNKQKLFVILTLGLWPDSPERYQKAQTMMAIDTPRHGKSLSGIQGCRKIVEKKIKTETIYDYPLRIFNRITKLYVENMYGLGHHIILWWPNPMSGCLSLVWFILGWSYHNTTPTSHQWKCKLKVDDRTHNENNWKWC